MINFIIGLFLGTNVSLFLYACIIAGKKANEKLFYGEITALSNRNGYCYAQVRNIYIVDTPYCSRNQ